MYLLIKIILSVTELNPQHKKSINLVEYEQKYNNLEMAYHDTATDFVQIVYLLTKQNHDASARCPHSLFAMWCLASTDLPPLWQWPTARQQQANTGWERSSRSP